MLAKIPNSYRRPAFARYDIADVGSFLPKRHQRDVVMSSNPLLKAALVLFVGLGSIVVTVAVANSDEKKPAKPKVLKIHISKKTTYFMSPVRKDGTVDYAAALNSRASRGVTPENNAAALLAQVCSRAKFSDSLLSKYNSKLGITKTAKRQRRMLTMSEFAKHVAGNKAEEYANKLYDEQGKAMEGPWARKDLRKLAAWLDHNSKPLAAVETALQRPKWYLPIVASTDSELLIAEPLPVVQSMRSIAWALSARALLAVHEGRMDAAARDLLTSHRLARSVAHGHFLIDALVGYAIEAITCSADAKMLQSGKLTEKQSAGFAQALAQLPRLRAMSEIVNFTERCVALDAILYLARNGPQALKELTDLSASGGMKILQVIQKSYALIDWNIPLQMVNEEFDRVHASMTRPSHKERKIAFAEFDKRLQQQQTELMNPKFAMELTKGGKVNRSKLSRAMGTIVIALFLPAVQQSRAAEDRNVSRFQLTRIAVALERYREGNGRFPEKLADLQPRFFKKIPADPYSGKPLIYRRSKSGYILYAVGENVQDDGGNTFGSKPTGDDIIVRITLAK
jgi:hypothetical protein